MKQHYSEADLLETYYTQPGASMPVMMHVADCGECSERYERLDRKVRGLAACEHDNLETFWSRQRISVMRKIDAIRSFPVARVVRVAVAVVVAFVLIGIVGGRVAESAGGDVEETTPPAEIFFDDGTPLFDDSSDPWQSEELNEFHLMVAWDSWVESGGQSRGGRSQ